MVLVLGFELVGQDFAVVADHAAGDSAVVVLMVDDAAAAGVEPLVADQAIVVLVLKVVAGHDAAARGPLTLKGGCGGTHGNPPKQIAGLAVRPTRERTGLCQTKGVRPAREAGLGATGATPTVSPGWGDGPVSNEAGRHRPH